MKGKISAALLALPLTAAGGLALFSGKALNTSAGAQTYFEGAESSGVIVADANCPVEVEREVLTLRISDLPDPASGTAEYGACAETEYVFYNPTENDVTMNLLLPYSEAGGYNCKSARSSGPCNVSVEGKEVSMHLRHTYRWGENPYGNVPLDGKQSDAFFSETLPVNEFVYRYERAEGSGKYFHLVLECNPAKTRVCFGGAAKVGIEDGKVHAVWQTGETSGEVSVYFIGEVTRSILCYFSTDAAGEEYTVDGGYLSLSVEKRTTDFSAFAEELRPADCAVGETDWYNGFVDMLNAKSRYGVAFVAPDHLCEDSFLRWYGYELTVPAGGRVASAVMTPIYPAIDSRDGNVYRYSYLLSGAQRWANVHSFEIKLETPYYVSDSSLKFETTDTGYYLKREGLPLGELTFSLTEEQAAAGNGFDPVHFLIPKIALAVGGVAVLIVGGATLAIVLAARAERRRNAVQASGVSEGKIPPERTERGDSDGQ